MSQRRLLLVTVPSKPAFRCQLLTPHFLKINLTSLLCLPIIIKFVWRAVYLSYIFILYSFYPLFSLLSGKCQPGWTLLGDTCFMYHGAPMTYRQIQEFCAKDNATLPTITNLYQYHLLAQYLDQQQEDWRYYDMVKHSF